MKPGMSAGVGTAWTPVGHACQGKCRGAAQVPSMGQVTPALAYLLPDFHVIETENFTEATIIWEFLLRVAK